MTKDKPVITEKGKDIVVKIIKKRNPQTPKDIVVSIIEKRNPKTIFQLINFVQRTQKISEEEILKILQELEDEKKIQFNEDIFPITVQEYFFSFKAAWYWVVMLLTIFTTISVFVVPENAVPIVYVRSVLGIIFVLYLPGYVLIKTLYPLSVPLKTRSITLDKIERIVLSLGLSLAITPIVGLILYYTPWGLSLAPITLSLLVMTVVFATFAIMREYRARKSIFLRRARKNIAYFKA